MTSLTKPLIAIASAVALVTTALVVSPANAAITASVTGATSGSGTVASPYVLNVPADNVVDTEALTIAVTVAANTNVTAAATGVKLLTALDTATTDVNSASGSATFSANSGTGTTVTFYAFTTSTTAGSVVVTVGGDTTTYAVKGAAGSAYNLSTVVPTVAGLGVDVDFTATATDVFGNAVENATITTSVLRGTVKTALTWDATDKRYEGVITTPAVAGAVAGIAKIVATDVAGLAKAKTESSFSIAAADLATQVVTLSAAVAAKDAEIKALKAKYNSLAKRYNKHVSKKYQVKAIK